jgi:ubiquitin C-terminal hydrolase
LSKGSPLTEAIHGQNHFMTRCASCKFVTQSFDVFLTLELKDNSLASTETIHDYECDKCRRRGPCVRQFRMSKQPRGLVVQVRRFDHSRDVKCQMEFEVLKQLSLTSATFPVVESLYDLTGVICHRGRTRYGGHYYAIVRVGSNYYCCDDEQVRTVRFEDMRLEDVYMIFYCKQ